MPAMSVTGAGPYGSKKKGFTLIEIMVVVFIIGLLAGITFPMLGNLTSDPLKRSTRKLSGVIRTLYFNSVMHGKVYRLVFDLDSNRYWSSEVRESVEFGERAKKEAAEKKKFVQLPGGVDFVDISTQRHGKVSREQVFTTFYPDGWFDYIEIRLKYGDRTLTVLPDSATGKVEIEAGYVERGADDPSDGQRLYSD